MSTEKGEPPFRGIDDLHRRLESLKMNRIELESRGRIKSEMNYPQTSKNSTKGRFDFKGKFYDNRERDFNLRGGF